MNKKIEWFLKILIGASFFVPLVVIPSSYIFPFIVPKILLFRSLTLLMLGGYILLLASNWQQYRLRMTATNIAVGLFFISFAVSTFVGVDWYKSFWDNHERMLGLFTIFHFVLYYYVVTAVISEWKDWKWFFRMFLTAGLVVMFIGILQKNNPEMLLNRGAGRVSATLGNAIYFSGYGLFLFFLGLYSFLKEKNLFWKYYAVFCGLMGFTGIFLGGTRGTLVGLLAGLFVLYLSYLINLQGYKKLRKIGFYVLLLGVGIFGILFAFRKTDFVSNIPALGRLLNTQITEGTANTRIMAWEIAVEAMKEKPVFGWGPNNYYYAFNKYYNPKFLENGWGETWFDNAHSAIFNTLAVQGIVGLILYVGLFAFPIGVIWKKRKNLDVHFVAISSAFLVGHFVHNAFVFENPTSYLYFFFFLAFVNNQSSVFSLQSSESPITNQKSPIKTSGGAISIGLSITVGLIMLLLIYSTNINPARANKTTLNAIKNFYSNPEQALQIYEEANSIPSPHIDDIRNDFARTSAGIVSQLMQQNKSEVAKNLFDQAYSGLDKNLILHPLDIRVHIQKADLALAGYQIWGNPQLVLDAEKNLENALTESPERQQVIYMLSVIKLQLSKNEEAINLLRKSTAADPKIAEGWWRLAVAYKQTGDEDNLTKLLAELTKINIKFTAEQLSILGINQ